MNHKAKGNRRELQSIELLESQVYRCTPEVGYLENLSIGAEQAYHGYSQDTCKNRT
jgi:hypothetical protein